MNNLKQLHKLFLIGGVITIPGITKGQVINNENTKTVTQMMNLHGASPTITTR